MIIGAGIGGLATGAHLAKHGIRTLVCERNDKPGGYFTSFTRAGYTFDAGIQGCENVGLRESIELKRSQVGHWTMSPGGAPAGFLTAMLASGAIRRRISAGKL